jgi:hypothetical protein
MLSTSFNHNAPKDSEYQIMEPVNGCFQICLSGFRVKQLVWVQYLVHSSETLTAVLDCNKVKNRPPGEKSLLESVHITGRCLEQGRCLQQLSFRLDPTAVRLTASGKNCAVDLRQVPAPSARYNAFDPALADHRQADDLGAAVKAL